MVLGENQAHPLLRLSRKSVQGNFSSLASGYLLVESAFLLVVLDHFVVAVACQL